MEGRKLSKKELKKLENQQKEIIRVRGEVTHWLVEIEALLDEIICAYFIRPAYFSHFMKILLWENFSMSLKIKLFNEIDFGKKFEEKKKQIIKDLNELNSIRNKIAHWLGIVTLKDKFIAGRDYKSILIDKKFLDGFRKKAINVLKSLKAILYYWAGISPKDLKNEKRIWVKIDKIGGHFAEKDNFKPKKINQSKFSPKLRKI